VRSLYLGALFCIIWIIVGHFVLLNMVISIVLTEFNAISEEADGSAFMSSEQVEWVRTQISIFDLSPPRPLLPPRTPWRRRLFWRVTSRGFELCIDGVIVMNAIAMASHVYDPASALVSQLTTCLFFANCGFMTIYLLEMGLKLVGLGPRQYFSRRRNLFDFALVLFGLLDIIGLLLNIDLPFVIVALRIFRLTRVLRMFRVLHAFRTLHSMTSTIMLSLPAVANVSVLLLLGIYVYAAICMQLFWAVDYTSPVQLAMANAATTTLGANATDVTALALYSYSDDGSNEGDYLNRHAHFHDFGRAFLTLARCVTGESYNQVMHELMGAGWSDNALRCCPTCGPVVDGLAYSSCGTSWLAVPIFLTFTFLLGFVVTSLFVGAFYETYVQVDDSDGSHVTHERLVEFKHAWVHTHSLAVQFRLETSRKSLKIKECTASKRSPISSSDDSLANDSQSTRRRPSSSRHRKRVLDAHLLPSAMLSQLLLRVPQPLGIADAKPAYTWMQQLNLIRQLAIPDRGNVIHFHEVLVRLAERVAGVSVPLNDATRRVQSKATKLPRLPPRSRDYSTDAVFVAVAIQAYWRGHVERRRFLSGRGGGERRGGDSGQGDGGAHTRSLRLVQTAHTLGSAKESPPSPTHAAVLCTSRL